MKNHVFVRVCLLLNVITVTLGGLLLLWFLGSGLHQFQSIFESMNVELPAATKAFLLLSERISGIHGLILAVGIVLTGIVLGLWTFKEGKVEVVLPLCNTIQVIGLFIACLACLVNFLPMMCLVSGTS